MVAGRCDPDVAPPVRVTPAVLLSSGGERVAAFASEAEGAPLFSAGTPPWAAAEDGAGRLWVTGRTAPVVYAPGGALALVAEALPFQTRGVAALAGGAVAVSYGGTSIALYDPDGAVSAVFTPTFGASYEGIDALLASPDGSLLVAMQRWDAAGASGPTAVGVVLRAAFAEGRLTAAQDPAASAALGPGIPSALFLAEGALGSAPPLGRVWGPACGRWLSADLGTDLGCVVPEPHRGVAWLPRWQERSEHGVGGRR